MCADPLTMALISGGAGGQGMLAGVTGLFSSFGGMGTALAAASTATAAYSGVQAGNAAKDAAKATAARQEEAARDSLRMGEDESDRQRRAGAAVLAQQRVAMAANGIDASAITAIEQLDDTKRLIETDAFAIRQNATKQATGFSQQAANSITEGLNAQSQGRMGAVSSLLSGGAKVGAKYSQWARERSPRYA